MIFCTSGNRIEIEVTRTVVFVRIPFIGEVCWTRTFGWQFWPWHEVRAQRQAQAAR